MNDPVLGVVVHLNNRHYNMGEGLLCVRDQTVPFVVYFQAILLDNIAINHRLLPKNVLRDSPVLVVVMVHWGLSFRIHYIDCR